MDVPPSLLESLRELPFVCPLCRRGLDAGLKHFACTRCRRRYPLLGGIPDFRVFPDPYLGVDEDRRRTERLLDVLDRYEFGSLLEYYWSLSDVTPPQLRARFIQGALLGEAKAQRVLRRLADDSPAAQTQRVLEIGSGTGDFLAVAAGHYRQVVGIDIAMRWLHVSRRRFRDHGLPTPPLVCCCAEHLPFPDGFYDRVVLRSTLEFVRDKERVLAECARALAQGGSLYLETPNRFALTPDPYVHLWGVGFLPRAWQPGYVRWRRQTHYEPVRLLSLRELKRLAGQSFAHVEVAPADFAGEALRSLPATTRLPVQLYRLLKDWPVFRTLLNCVGPQWEVRLANVRSAA